MAINHLYFFYAVDGSWKVFTMQYSIWSNKQPLISNRTLIYYSRNIALLNNMAKMVMQETSVWKVHTLKLGHNTHFSGVYMDDFTQHP
jgi:hypothetical protein